MNQQNHIYDNVCDTCILNIFLQSMNKAIHFCCDQGNASLPLPWCD